MKQIDLLKQIDLPPVWLVLCLVAAWAAPWRFVPGALSYVGWSAIGLGVVLTLAAVFAFVAARTTIIPRQDPTALITTGIFGWTRNPIYLADVLFLFGASLVLGSFVGLFLVPVFAIFLDRRFIRGEEAVMQAHFGTAFDDYSARVRRWV